MQFRGKHPVRNFQRLKNSEDILNALSLFLGYREDVRERLVERLFEIRTRLEKSKYLKQHEVWRILSLFVCCISLNTWYGNVKFD